MGLSHGPNNTLPPRAVCPMCPLHCRLCTAPTLRRSCVITVWWLRCVQVCWWGCLAAFFMVLSCNAVWPSSRHATTRRQAENHGHDCRAHTQARLKWKRSLMPEGLVHLALPLPL